MKRLDPIYKSLLNEEINLWDFHPDFNIPMRYDPMGPPFQQWQWPPVPKPPIDVHNLQPNVYAPDGYVNPTQEQMLPKELADKYVKKWVEYIQNRPNQPKSPPPIPPGITLIEWLMILAALFPWLFPTQIGGNPAGYPPGTGPDNWTGDWPPPLPEIYPPNTPIG
jgi:hypothetical protein